ncbi:hypothetical protein [Pyxidicoccus trucidator]|uniref:hypothetical protein n=1 Tax=Pyxidicoccus trucidator TaxID=2709662 RepID=UPI0013DD1106|nr:hypothetical protein [Pyxidicoccus trucidator]
MCSRRLALLGRAVLLVTSLGCTTPGGVSLRADGTPGPEECSQKAREAMRYLRLFVGEAAQAELDANQGMTDLVTLYEGPVESMLIDDLGLLDAPARLYGRVWTDGPQVVIRYYEAQPLDGGDTVPICAVARLGLGQMRKRPDSKPGTAILGSSRAAVFIVDTFR